MRAKPQLPYWLMTAIVVVTLVGGLYDRYQIYKLGRRLEVSERELRLSKEQHQAAVQQLMDATAELALRRP